MLARACVHYAQLYYLCLQFCRMQQVCIAALLLLSFAGFACQGAVCLVWQMQQLCAASAFCDNAAGTYGSD
jgi:hypothetical protein